MRIPFKSLLADTFVGRDAINVEYSALQSDDEVTRTSGMIQEGINSGLIFSIVILEFVNGSGNFLCYFSGPLHLSF